MVVHPPPVPPVRHLGKRAIRLRSAGEDRMSHTGVNLIHEAQCDPQSLYPLSCSTCEAARAGRRYPDKNEGEQVNIDELMTRAALECIDERERHLAIYSVGLNAYVCRNEAVVDESR